MRIAVINYDKCQPKKCSLECFKSCPGVRMGEETIVISESGKPEISEELCTGCNICVKKCPFEAIYIINLPDELGKEIIHCYGENRFRLYRLPFPKENSITGIIGQNGTGKTTIIKILSGNLIPNLGDIEEEDKDKLKARVIKHFSGREVGEYFMKLYNGRIKVAYKPQYIDALAKLNENAGRAIDKVCELEEEKERIIKALEIEKSIERNFNELSGGELQRIAIAMTLLKDADIYFFDEPGSYLDIKQRLNLAKLLQSFENKRIVVVEHDLIVLDYICDYVYALYGIPGAYGISTMLKTAREGINEYLLGYFREENIKLPRGEVKFDKKSIAMQWKGKVLTKYKSITKKYTNFELFVEAGEIRKGEIIGILGANATGKTTFAKILAGVIESDEGKIDLGIKISYKPQYIKIESNETVEKILKKINENLFSKEVMNETIKPLEIEHLFEQKISELSGGELQRVAIAACLLRDADIYLLDEPSAYLDVEQRIKLAKLLRKFAEKKETSCMIIDHDLLFIDYISDRFMVFLGEPGKKGVATPAMEKRKAMNKFLSSIGITFRRDRLTLRPRANKPESVKDREQKKKGEYYYEAF